MVQSLKSNATCISLFICYFVASSFQMNWYIFKSKFSSFLNDFFETKTFLVSSGTHFRMHKTSFWVPTNLIMKQSYGVIMNELIIMILKFKKPQITNFSSICDMKRRKQWWLTNFHFTSPNSLKSWRANTDCSFTFNLIERF